MNTKRTFPILGGFIFAVAVLTLATPAFAQTVTTDRSDYHPGNIVSIIGNGWVRGEIVTLVIRENPATNPDVSLSVTADAGGNFETEDFTVPDNAADSNYTVTASNLGGFTAQVAFNDSAAGALCAAFSGHGASVCPSAIGATGVLGQGVTHYKQTAGSTATYQIIVVAPEQAPLVEASDASFCRGGVKVLVKSSFVGNTLLCGNVMSGSNGSYIITF